MGDTIECNSVECNSIKCTFTESDECNSIQISNLNAALLYNQQFRLNKINEIKDYFITEVKERESMSK